MDEQDKQDLGTQSELKFGSITEAIMGSAFEVINFGSPKLEYKRFTRSKS